MDSSYFPMILVTFVFRKIFRGLIFLRMNLLMPILFIIAKKRKIKKKQPIYVLQLVNEVTGVHPYDETLHSNKKEENFDTQNNTNKINIKYIMQIKETRLKGHILHHFYLNGILENSKV